MTVLLKTHTHTHTYIYDYVLYPTGTEGLLGELRSYLLNRLSVESVVGRTVWFCYSLQSLYRYDFVRVCRACTGMILLELSEFVPVWFSQNLPNPTAFSCNKSFFNQWRSAARVKTDAMPRNNSSITVTYLLKVHKPEDYLSLLRNFLERHYQPI